MTRGEIAARFAVDEGSRLTLARVLDRAALARSRDIPGHTHFLTDGEQALCVRALAAAGESRYLFRGGYEGASRKICLFLPGWMETWTWDGEDDPLAALAASLPEGAGLTHRDVLGSLMGLGITREVIGDILMGEGACQVICLRSALPILLSQWESVGRHPVRPAPLPLDRLTPTPPETHILRETFQSLRFDAVAAAAFRLPRAKAAALIAAGRLELNHLPCAKPDRLLQEGDVLTGRGYGKCVLRRVTGQSRKGRLAAELERYGRD